MQSIIVALGVVAASILCTDSKVFAAIPVRQAISEKQNHYVAAGIFVGGYDHGPVSLVNVRHSLGLSTQIERVVFDLNQDNVPNTETQRPCFFHIAIQQNPKRVVIDLENVTESEVTADQVTKLLIKSPYISKTIFYPDSRNRNLTIELLLKKKAQAEVFELVSVGKPGRIVLDLKGL